MHLFKHSRGQNGWFCLFFCMVFSLSVGAQRVGIGTSEPQARLAVDSGIVVDQANSNLPFTPGRNVGLFFGSPQLAGITSSKESGSQVRSGLTFWTGGARRMHIDSMGQVGIGGSPANGYRLNVSGGPTNFNGFVTMASSLEVDGAILAYNRIIVNSSTPHDALLYLKGRSFTPNGWGQHIVMEALSGNDSAAILYDGDLKMRVFGANDNFVFRNAENTTVANINSLGNMTVSGNLTTSGNLVANGNGLVQSGNSSQMQISMLVTGAGLNWTIGPGVSVNFTINYSGFSGTPIVVPGTWSNVTNESHLLVTATDVTATSATIIVRNVGSATSVATNSNFRAAIIGVRN